MLSHVDMAPAAAGFKLFGKVITQCAADGAQAAAAPALAARAKEEEEEPATIKRDETKPTQCAKRAQLQEAAEARAAAAAPLPCPRCRSRDTKFCYFNNYNVNQPRHFCKACHRYWTAGGALRNVPVGAGRRKKLPPPLGPVVRTVQHLHDPASPTFVLGFPGPASPTSPVYADHRWQVGPRYH